MITPLTLQQWFDNALLGIRKQGTFARGVTTGFATACFYRQAFPSGKVNKCAIGHSIPDELYCDGIENASIKAVIREGKIAPLMDGKVTPDQLASLQSIHDHAADMTAFEIEMAVYANTHDLKFTPLV